MKNFFGHFFYSLNIACKTIARGSINFQTKNNRIVTAKVITPDPRTIPQLYLPLIPMQAGSRAK